MKLKRELRFEDVRRVCVDNNLYTKGFNEDYEKLMLYVKLCIDLQDDELITIAQDILNHSITDYSLDTIITILNGKIFITVVNE